MKNFFAYVRVSTARQGEGVSLPEQRSVIDRFAAHEGIHIVRWFEERETASKVGRPRFNEMLRLLKRGVADGVVVHKVDRSARNMQEWAEFEALTDAGIDARVASDSIDLSTRSGRLTANFQAVMAADYSRNLREEVKKGIYGRLKQGLYPFGAPIGYLDQGGGKAKTLDPVKGPLVRRAFDLYATGQYSLETLATLMYDIGLRSRMGGRIEKNALSVILRNPFYAGVIRIFRTGQTFEGIHPRIVSKTLFDTVQDVLDGRKPRGVVRHDLAFRKALVCDTCGRTLIGERQKGYVYYRCHSRHATTCVREELVDTELQKVITSLSSLTGESQIVQAKLATMTANHQGATQTYQQALALRRGQVEARMTNLTDALIDSLIDRATYEQRREALLLEKRQIDEDRAKMPPDPGVVSSQILKMLERGNMAQNLAKTWTSTEKRNFLVRVTSNRRVNGKNVVFTLKEPFQSISKQRTVYHGAPLLDAGRTWDDLLAKLWAWASNQLISGADDAA